MLLAYSDRPIDTNTTFTTGGDVSRFERRSVPGRAGSGGMGGQAMAGLEKGIGQVVTGHAAAGDAPVVAGPVVRVARGNEVTVVPVGAR
jgi:pilus assembly protein CpaB